MIFVGGDFNSKIGTQNDFIIENEKDLNYLSRDYELDTIRSVRNKVKDLKRQNARRSSRALDICRLSWMQYNRFSFDIRSISDKVNYSGVSFNSRFEFFV